jgi:hypothetical protein
MPVAAANRVAHLVNVARKKTQLCPTVMKVSHSGDHMQYYLQESDLNVRKVMNATGIIDTCKNIPRPESNPCRDHGKIANY